MSPSTAKKLLRKATDNAMTNLKQMKVYLKSQEETMVVFDCLVTDFLLQEQKVEVEMWRAACFQHKLHEDQEEVLPIMG